MRIESGKLRGGRVLSENAVKNAIVEYLRFKGALILRINSGAVVIGDDGRFVSFVKWFILGDDPQTAGVPDLIAILPGMALAIECKAPGRKGNVSEVQARFMAEWERRGWVAVVDVGVEDVERVLEGVG